MAEVHRRIDEGIKRGPKKQRIALKRPQELVSLSPIIPSHLDPREVLDRYLTERHTSQIAESYGVSRRNLVRWLREVMPDQWKQVEVVRALIYKEDGEEAIEDATDALALARAREMVKSAQWNLERLDSGTFGVKVEQVIDINHHVLVEHGLADSALTLFESMRGITHTDQPVIEQDKD